MRVSTMRQGSVRVCRAGHIIGQFVNRGQRVLFSWNFSNRDLAYHEVDAIDLARDRVDTGVVACPTFESAHSSMHALRYREDIAWLQ